MKKEEEKMLLSHKVACFQAMLDFGLENQIRGKLLLFLKTTLLQRGELFLKMFYTINSSSLLVTK